MSEKLDETVNTILQNAVEAASRGTEFLKEQLPDVLQQLILWKTWSYAITLFVCVAFFVWLIWKGIPLLKRLWEWDDDGLPCCLAALVYTAAFIAACIGFFANGYDLIQIALAPKVWLLEYAANLVKH